MTAAVIAAFVPLAASWVGQDECACYDRADYWIRVALRGLTILCVFA